MGFLPGPGQGVNGWRQAVQITGRSRRLAAASAPRILMVRGGWQWQCAEIPLPPLLRAMRGSGAGGYQVVMAVTSWRTGVW